MNTTVAHLAAFLPRDRAAQVAAGAPLAAEGVALIGDISGFTPLTETLARELSPARGGEELTRALNGVFAPLIDEAHRYGGSVIKFAGDALIVWFPRSGRGRRDIAVRRALAAAAGMQAAIVRHGQVRTPAGPFTLTMKVGMAYGPALRVRLGDSVLGYEDVIGGETLDRMAEAEHHAGSGEIVLDPAGIVDAAGLALVKEVRDGYLVVAGPARPVAAGRRRPRAAPADDEGLAEAMRPYLPAEVFDALRDGRAQTAELKPVVSIFVQFQGIVYEDTAQAEAQLAAYFAAAQATAARYGGRVNRLLTGDKGSVLHMIFGAPRAVEELERRAALCLLELRRVAGELGFISAQRIGAAAGRVFAGPVGSPERRDYTVMGDTINLSARLMQGAAAGQIVIDAALSARLAGEFALDDLGLAQMKGKANPVSRFALLRQVAQAPRRAARAYGRGMELDSLRRQVELLAGGRGGVAVLIGALGMGKSHLLAALRASTVLPSPPLPPRGGGAGGGGASLLWAGAAAAGYGQPRSGALIAAALGELLGLAGADDPAAQLGAALSDLLGARAGAAAFPYLARFLGLPLDDAMGRELAALAGESLRWRVFALLGEIVRAACARQPLVLALDDLQWADPTSRELIESLLPLAEELPLLLILASRPGGPGVEDAAPRPLRIELGPLDKAAALAVVAQHAPGLGMAARERLAARGQGNPLFLVELARTAAQGGNPDELPDSVQGLLLAQIDRLPGELRETLQLAAVLGPGFAPRLLAALAGPGAPLDARLEALEAAGFLLRAGEGYGFRHILIRESAYGAMLFERRRGHHGAAAAAIERLYPTRLAERSGELAEHYERAEQLGAAARYHGQAADGARLLYANAEAEAGYRHVLALLEKGEGDEGLRARTYLKLAQVQMNEGDYAAAQELYDVAFELLEREEAQKPALRGPAPVFRMGTYEPETIDPALVTTVNAAMLSRELFEGLVSIDSALNVIPAAARRWRVEDGGRRYMFELRPELKWSDGAPLNAHDFVFAWRRNLHPDTQAGMASQLYPIAGAADYHSGANADISQLKLRVIDELTIDIELTAPTSHFLAVLTTPIAFPQPSALIQRLGKQWSHPDTIISNGQYIIKDWVPGRVLELQRNPHYHRWIGEIENVHLHFGSPAHDIERMTALDLVRCEDRPDLAERHKGITLTIQYLNTYLLGFDCSRPPFNDSRLRRVFAMAIDRQRLSQEVWRGIQQPAEGGVVPPGMPGHSPHIGALFDPEAARKLLAESGARIPPIRLATLSGLATTPEFLCDAWHEHLGVTVDIVDHLLIEDLINGLATGQFQMAIFGWDLDFPEPADILRTLFYGSSPLNFFGWRSDRFDALIDDAIGQAQSADRLARFRAADYVLVADEVATVPLYHSRTLALLGPGYALADGGQVVRGGRIGLDQIVRTS